MPAPTKTDVVICGSGSAGLCAALWLTRYGVPYTILERRPGPLERGQADGVQCRTVEIFESFGLSGSLLQEAYHVLEVAFWADDASAAAADDDDEVDANGDDRKEEEKVKKGNQRKEGGGGIRRTHFAPDTAPGLSHQPHVILNQARINGLMLDAIRRFGGAEALVEYGCEVRGVTVDGDGDGDETYPVRVLGVKDGVEREYRAKYALGCDGAHSTVRKSLGLRMVGDSSDAVWGVMDVYPRTDFPDIRKKAIVHSAAGSLVLIPREGDSLVRLYIEQEADTRAADVTPTALTERARRILHPYGLDVAANEWWSAYAIGQRLADGLHDVRRRVFLMGDACHTHSPKAGQGMNVSLQDGYNIGWKLGAVLTGRSPSNLLETYVGERGALARALIDFDAQLTRMFSTRYRRERGISAHSFKEQFVRAGEYTAGLATRYGPSMIVCPDDEKGEEGGSAVPRHGGKLAAGMRFPSAQVVRFSDAKPLQLASRLESDGRWRVVVFGGDIQDPDAAARLEKVASSLSSIVPEFTAGGSDPDSAIQSLLVVKSKRTEVDQARIPGFFWPARGRWGIRDLHGVFVDDESYNAGHGRAYEAYGVSPGLGALVVVRPDQYIAKICPLQDADSLGAFFRRVLIPIADSAAAKGQ